ncbi:MAG: cob(I)yrinic acid a,c-diamide adenosyltransferase [Bacteroidales bacterium]|jgi:cob(I)alamin adenosyltransferase|nr:cob(I)yrinic acid a,c-diamide adenosyltransferase [Bacteroidales bacterium]
MKIYSLTGDDGTTSLAGGRRVAKHSLRVESYGSIDELMAWIGLLRDIKENAHRKDMLIYIQNQLMSCAAVLASDYENTKATVVLPAPDCVTVLENEIDKMDTLLTPLQNFVLPGGALPVSYCHIARCVCRRAERTVAKLNETEKTPAIVMKFLNRLSDYLFVLSRSIASDVGINDEV